MRPGRGYDGRGGRVVWVAAALGGCRGPVDGPPQATDVRSTPTPTVPAPTGGDSAPPAQETAHSGAAVHSAAPIVPLAGFSFVDATVAGMPQPYDPDLPFLAEQDLALLVSLTTVPVDPASLAAVGLEGAHLPIADMTAPTPAQQETWVGWVRERRDRGEKVGVHCTAGLGRTGTMLATWFVAEGMGGDEAIDHVRALRPGSIETLEQEDAVRAYAAVLGW